MSNLIGSGGGGGFDWQNMLYERDRDSGKEIPREELIPVVESPMNSRLVKYSRHIYSNVCVNLPGAGKKSPVGTGGNLPVGEEGKIRETINISRARILVGEGAIIFSNTTNPPNSNQ